MDPPPDDALTFAWLRLSLTPGLGPILIRRLVAAAGGAGEAVNASLPFLRSIEGFGHVGAEKVCSGLRASVAEAGQTLDQVRRGGMRVVTFDEPEYPPLLRLIPDPPPVLYVRGHLLPRDVQSIAIVGSRKCSHYGREQAQRFGALLAADGLTTVSGGARGIDTAAHRGALAHADGRTVAVLGSGIDVVYPPENRDLFDAIADGHGAVVSEYPPGTIPLPTNFPKRNRIVSGITRATLVIEADDRSGALITARQAGEDQGRPVLALPGRVDVPTSRGTHKLIRDGATLVTNLEDVLEALDALPDGIDDGTDVYETTDDPACDGDIAREQTPVPVPPAAEPAVDELFAKPADQKTSHSAVAGSPAAMVLRMLDGQPLSPDVLAERSGLPIHVVLAALTTLSLTGRATRVEGQSYVRK